MDIKIKYIILYLFALFILHGQGFGQTNLYIEDLSAKINLPNGSINCIEQDDAGFIWLGTWKGLYRYDGYNVVNFSHINHSFNALKISTLHFDGRNLWVGSFITGLYQINLSNYSFSQYTDKSDSLHYITNNDILSICSVGNKIVASTERGGFCVINGNGNVEARYNLDKTPEIVANAQISKVIALNESEIVFCSNNLTIFNIDTKQVRKYISSAFYTYTTDILKISNDEFLIGSSANFYSVKLRNNVPEIKIHYNQRTNSILKNTGAEASNYLIGTVDGVFEYNHSTQILNKFRFNQSDQISKQTITSLKRTNDNAILIGSESGLYSLILRKQHFSNIGADAPDEAPPVISCIHHVGNELFAGSWGKGLFRIDKNTKKLEPIVFTGFNQNPPRFIYALAERDGRMWFSCKNYHGIFSFDYTRKPYQLEYIHLFEDQLGNTNQYVVTSIYVTKDKNLYLGTWEGLVFFENKHSGRFSALTDPNGKLPSSKNLGIYSLIEDHEHNLWIGINGGGVIRFKLNNNVIIDEKQFTDKDGLTSNFVTQIYQSRNNKIWIGTEKGLTLFEKEQFSSVFNKDIPFDIQSIIEDPIGFLWLGTQNGLIRFNSNQPEEPYKLFDRSDGLRNESFFLGSVDYDEDYTFFLGGFQGIDFFTPYKIEYNYNKPTPQITNFALFNENVYPITPIRNNFLKSNIQNTKNLKLKHYQNTFSIEFSNLEFQIPEKCQFAFILEGVDSDWNYRNSKNRVAYYTKLSPGNYVFKLRSTNNDGIWCDTPAVLSISIVPPFWASTWAYIIYFIIAMILIFLIISTRIIKVQEKHEQQIRELEYKKQKELDELKLRFFTNISHEFRTPLTLILGPIARILENQKNDPYYENHLMIFRNANRLLHLTNRIMDFRKNEKEQLKLKVELANLTEFIRNIYVFFKYEAEKRNIKYQFKTDIEGNSWFDREFIESVAFNLLSNSFKYTPDGRSISVILTKDSEWISIKFADTGKGITNEDLKHIFDRFYSTTKNNSAGIGLSFTQRLVEMHKGKLEVQSTFGIGSTFTLKLPIADVYTSEEKILTTNRENLINWEKVDQETRNRATTQLNNLKSIFAKEELIALIADDNFEVRNFLRTLLDDSFKVLEATNGKEALELAFNHMPDIIISDVMMPEMTGLDLCKAIKSDIRTDHIPIILTTVLSSQADRVEGLNLGADSFIPKPIDPAHLLVRVNKLIEKQLRLKDKFNLSSYDNKELVEKDESSFPETNPLIEKARIIVLENIDNSEYNIDDFSRDLGLSRMQLYRKFKAVTGLSANSFIRKVRLHKAAELIKSGKYSIKEVTYDVGFTDLKYFRKCFFEEFGVNPSDYE